MNERGEAQKMRWWEWALLLVGLFCFGAQAAFSSPVKSAAFDEQYHLMHGYAYLRTGDFRMSLSHPPLVNVLSALPLLWLDDINLPLEHPTWAETNYFNFTDVFAWEANDHFPALLLWARLPVIALGMLLVGALFGWARQMAGPAAGWVALVLAAFDPNLIANARLVTTDFGLTCFLTLTMWRLWHWLVRPSRFNLVLTGILAGLTMASKFTGLFVWPMILLVTVLWRPETGNWRLKFSNLRSLISNLLLIGIFAYLALWAVYGFDVSPIPETGFALPLPASYYPYSVWQTFVALEAQPKTAFLLGQISQRGWWYYFPVTLALKTPFPLMLLTVVGAIGLWRRQDWRRTAVYWLPPLLFLGLAMIGGITIGYRHILPLVPFLIMLASCSVSRLGIGDWRLTPPNLQSLISNLPFLSLTLLLLWQMIGVSRLFPHYEAFFNELAGGPEGGGRFLVDSNIDWGQDLPALKQLMDERGIGEVYLAYFGTAPPEAYGIRYRPIPGFLRFTTGAEINGYNPYTPPPGWYAISLTSLRLGLLEQNVDMYAFFRDKEPVTQAGYSINLYEVTYPDAMPVDRVLVTGTAVSDLTPAELGLQPGHRLVVKWTAAPETTITIPPAVFDYAETFAPVQADFGGAFTLIGYEIPQTTWPPGDAIRLRLHWQVASANVETPAPTANKPLAAFVHLSGEDPAQIVAQFDGWDTALTGLERGDVISQSVTLQVPGDTAPGTYYLRVGLYSPQSGGRLPVDGETADFVTLRSIVITELAPKPQ